MFLVGRCRLIYTVQLHPAAPQQRSYNRHVCQTLQWRSKNHECANVPGWFPVKAAAQAACLPCRQPVQGQLSNFHDSLHLILSNFSHYSHSLSVSRYLDAEVHFVNMTALTRGGLHSSFWIVDRKHIYIGSADMDWRSLSKVTTNIDNMSVQNKIRPEDKWAAAVRCGQVCGSFLASKWLQ